MQLGRDEVWATIDNEIEENWIFFFKILSGDNQLKFLLEKYLEDLELNRKFHEYIEDIFEICRQIVASAFLLVFHVARVSSTVTPARLLS